MDNDTKTHEQKRRDEAFAVFERTFSALTADQVDPRALATDVQHTRAFCAEPASRALLLRALSVKGLLKPAPEVFWRVDRGLEEYRARLGINLRDLLIDVAPHFPKPTTVLELGSGSGRAAEQLASELGANLHLTSINDKVCYPVRGVVGAILRRQLKNISLTTIEFDSLVDWIYKVASLRQGTSARDVLEYDDDTMRRLTRGVNELTDIVRELAPKLKVADAVPSEFGIQPSPSSGQKYPNKILRAQLPNSVQAYLHAIESDPGLSLKQTNRQDLYEDLEVYLPGMMLGDFAEVVRIKSRSIALAFSVRGTTYLRDRPEVFDFAYSDFVLAAVRSLEDHGLYIDDGVRENFGKRYRLPELIRVKGFTPKETPTEIWLVIGPGVAGDDHNQEAAVRATVIVNGRMMIDVVRRHLVPGYYLRPLSSVVDDSSYLLSLDPYGRALEEVTRARSSV